MKSKDKVCVFISSAVCAWAAGATISNRRGEDDKDSICAVPLLKVSRVMRLVIRSRAIE